MKNLTFVLAGLVLISSANIVTIKSARALELDWTGQFRTEVNLIHNYTMDSNDSSSSFDPDRYAGNGYYVPASGQKSANFQNLFLRLKPKLIVNDNVYVKSEWWVGDPIYGLYGNGAPYSRDQRQLNSTFNRGAALSAQRFWAEILSDFGTFQIGRAPLNYGLGLVWHNGDGLYDRYQSTGDVVRLVSKFGAFSFSPAFISYSTGNSIGGACSYVDPTTPGLVTPALGPCRPGAGPGGINDYAIMLKYDNQEEDFEAGVNFIRRLAGADQDPRSGFLGPNSTSTAAAGMNYNIWDLFGRRKFGRLSFSGEVPITTGSIAGVEYSSFALAAEANWKINDSWEILGRAGQAPGQPNAPVENPGKWELFAFHPNYKLGMIMFNYQLANFAGINTLNDPRFSASQLSSPYDNPITNARYLGVSGKYRTDKWTFHGDWVFAKARQTAKTGEYFYHMWQRRMVLATKDQEDSLGFELDTGGSLQWDDNFRFGLDFYFPGNFFKFNNVAGLPDNQTSMVFATVLSAGITF